MVKNLKFIINGLENPKSLTWAAIITEQADELGLEQVLIVEAVLDNERDDLVELFYGSAELKENGCRVRVDMRRNVGSLGKGVKGLELWG